MHASAMTLKKESLPSRKKLLDVRAKPKSQAPVPYWKNQYNQKIFDKFNQLDLDVRMKIVGSNVTKKNETRLKSHSSTKLPMVNRLKVSGFN